MDNLAQEVVNIKFLGVLRIASIITVSVILQVLVSNRHLDSFVLFYFWFFQTGFGAVLELAL